MATKRAVKPRNPQDSTRRNVRASNARDAALATRVTALEKKLALVNLMVEQLLTRLA